MVGPDSLFFRYMTVDTNVKEDPFVVYKDMLLDQNLPRITRIDTAILSWRPSTLRCLFVASMGNGFWFHWDGKLADLQFGGESICTWRLYFTAANKSNSHSLSLYTILYQIQIRVLINFMFDALSHVSPL